MNGINKVILLARLGSDPEVKYLQSGSAVCNFRVATTEKWKDKATGEAKELTEWTRITCFGRLAELAGEYLRKGSRVYIEGSMRTREWEKDGQKHYTTEVNARELQFLDSRGSAVASEAAEPAQEKAQKPMSARRQAQLPAAADDFEDSDLPF